MCWRHVGEVHHDGHRWAGPRAPPAGAPVPRAAARRHRRRRRQRPRDDESEQERHDGGEHHRHDGEATGHESSLATPQAGTDGGLTRLRSDYKPARRRNAASSRSVGPPARAAFQLAARSVPATTYAGVLRLTEPRHLAAQPLDERLSLVCAAWTPACPSGRRSCPARGRSGPRRVRPRRRRHRSPGCTPAVRSCSTRARVPRLVEEAPHAGRHDRPHVGDLLELLRRTRHQRDRASRTRARAPARRARRRAGCPGACSSRHSSCLPAPVDLRDELGRDLRAEPPRAMASFPPDSSRAARPLGVSAIEVGEVVHQSGRHQRVDQRLAQPLDVHGPPGGEVLERPPDARRARRVLAPPHHLVLGLLQHAAAGRTRASA